MSYSQEMLGMTLGNYSGVPGLTLNPAMATNNRSFLDINLVSADVFFRNNFAYIPASSFNIWDLLKKDYTFPTFGDNNSNFLYYQDHNLKDATVNLRIIGPSAMFQYGKHGFGLQTGVRYFASGNRLPWEVPVWGYEGLIYDPLYNIMFNDYDFQFNTTAWMEVGLSYAYDIYDYADQKLTLGISLKKLWGYSGATVNVNQADYVVLNDSTISITNLDAQAGYALPMDYNQSGFQQTGPTFKGSGIGMDLGMVYTKRKDVITNHWRGGRPCSQQYHDYIYRLGVSILDIGRLMYRNNAQQISYQDVNVYWDKVDTLGFNNMNQLVTDLSTVLYGDPNASFSGNNVKIGLPTALSIQFDYHWKKNFYTNIMWIHPLRFSPSVLRRPAQLAVVPRWENRWVELSIPISYYEYTYPRIGFAARFYFFTIGTERLGTYLGMADMNGLDIYTSIRFSLDKNSCHKRFGGACSNSSFGNKGW